MTESEFGRIRSILKLAYKNFLNDPAQVDFWFGNLKRYGVREVEDAARNYILANEFEPKISSIIKLIKHADPSAEFRPRYENINGRTVKVIQCQRCRDTGLMTWDDDEGRTIGRPCDCPAGHAKYRWGWLSKAEQEDACRRRADFDSRLIGISWT